MADTASETDKLALVVQVLAAYLSHNRLRSTDLPDLIRNVHAALHTREPSAPDEAAVPEMKVTATQIRQSIRPDHLVSFEDGRPYKVLRRHLAQRGLTPAAYRKKWGLPADYPMVARNYSAQRFALAKSFGLGRGWRAEEDD